MSNNTPTHQRPSIRCDTKRSIDAEIAVTRFPLSGERIEHGYFYIYIYTSTALALPNDIGRRRVSSIDRRALFFRARAPRVDLTPVSNDQLTALRSNTIRARLSLFRPRTRVK